MMYWLFRSVILALPETQYMMLAKDDQHNGQKYDREVNAKPLDRDGLVWMRFA